MFYFSNLRLALLFIHCYIDKCRSVRIDIDLSVGIDFDLSNTFVCTNIYKPQINN